MMMPGQAPSPRLYRGRIAPSPTGLLHLGHARTFWIAAQRAKTRDGVLIFRNEDLDRSRCRAEFVEAMFTDLKWLGLNWQEGPDCGGPSGPYHQSERGLHYEAAFEALRTAGCLFPCTCSRQDVLRAAQAPHAGEDEPVYPGTCRSREPFNRPSETQPAATKINWRFRVPNGEVIAFEDGGFGPQQFIAGQDFGDFVVWRHDGTPAYQLAVVVDDAAMNVTEVVRGADLLRSTARQLLLFRALGLQAPQYYHCPLVTDAAGMRLAKRHDALSLRALRGQGRTPESLRQEWEEADKGRRAAD
ncbi:MAG: tRNA glutamyl-Q(34) synthetase GluQRS [Verrucomicrobiota bacterium]